MDKIALTKNIAKGVVGISTGFTVHNIIKNNTSAEKRRQQAEIAVGSFVIGAIVAERAETWTDRQIDGIVTWYNENFKKA